MTGDADEIEEYNRDMATKESDFEFHLYQLLEEYRRKVPWPRFVVIMAKDMQQLVACESACEAAENETVTQTGATDAEDLSTNPAYEQAFRALCEKMTSLRWRARMGEAVR